jgi:acyl dehydratase
VTPLEVSGPRALKEHLHSEVGLSDFLEIPQTLIDRFAEVSGDRQWIHVDVERAREQSPFGGTVAHGFLTLSLLSRFVEEVVRVEGTRLLVNCGLASVRFVSPVPAGARVRARVRLRECSEGTDFVQATWRVTIECEGARLPACIADWIVRYYA